MEFEGNSNSAKRSGAPVKKTAEPVKKVEQKVSAGAVVRKKQPISKRLKEHFFPSRDESVSDYVVFGVLLPAAQNAISEAVSQGIDIIMFGEASRGSRRTRARTRTEYSRMSGRRPAPWEQQEDPREQVSRRARATHSFDLFVIPERGDAEEVLDELINCLSQYDQVTVGDFYDAIGETKEFTDENYGWTTLAGTRIIAAGRDGWVIDLPPTELLKRGR